MKEFSVNGVNYIGVYMPPNCTDFVVEGNILFWTNEFGDNDNMHKLPHEKQYEIIGIVHNLTWEQKCTIYPDYKESVNEFRACLMGHLGINLTDNTLIIKVI